LGRNNLLKGGRKREGSIQKGCNRMGRGGRQGKGCRQKVSECRKPIKGKKNFKKFRGGDVMTKGGVDLSKAGG